MGEWKDYRLGEITIMKNGKKRPQNNGTIPVYGGNGIMDYCDTYNAEKTIIVGRVGAYCGCVYKSTRKCWVSDNAISVSARDVADFDFLYYLMLNLDLHHQHIGGAQPLMTQDIIGNFEIKIPTLSIQKRIASILSSLDDKIEVNRRINENLEAQAQALFKSWFVDFDPFKDGEFVESELGMIPKGWEVGNLFDVASIFDKIRKPLSGKERENMKKVYPYYGATSCMDYVDSYLFDGVYTLIGEDGSVAKENGLPYMQYVWGKFWVNNHAHILQGKNGFSTEMIHVFLSMTNIKHLVTGAVQAKLSQANMQKIMLPIPPLNIVDQIRPIFDSLYKKKRNCDEETIRLAELRDTLLPRLMSGELKIIDIEKSL
jgi:type I restriction enzyme S subunit